MVIPDTVAPAMKITHKDELRVPDIGHEVFADYAHNLSNRPIAQKLVILTIMCF